jgi:hypothetical protein
LVKSAELAAIDRGDPGPVPLSAYTGILGDLATLETTVVTPFDGSVYALYVDEQGSDANSGEDEAHPKATVKAALDKVKDAYALSGWTAQSAVILISGTITGDVGTANGMVEISGGGYPPIALQGLSREKAGTIKEKNGGDLRAVLYIKSSIVTMGDYLTLTGAVGGFGVNASSYNSTFTMNGGTISGNTASGDGRGVYGITYSSQAFVIRDGTIPGNGRGGKARDRALL